VLLEQITALGTQKKADKPFGTSWVRCISSLTSSSKPPTHPKRLKTPSMTWYALARTGKDLSTKLWVIRPTYYHAPGVPPNKSLREAEGYKEKRVLLAEGEANRFLNVLAEYEKAKEVTSEQLHLETVERILPEIDKLIVDGAIAQRLVPMLPFGGTITAPVNIPAPVTQPQTPR
jgi:hypothetical protein